jgi:hypothetical protein
MRTGMGVLTSLAILLFATTAWSDSSFPIPANIRITNTPQLSNEEQVIICPTDSATVMANWRDFRLGYRQIGLGRSTDGGATWSDSLISPDMQFFGLASWQSDPTLTVDRFGNYVMSVLDFIPGDNTSNSVISFYRSTDKGISWTGPFVPSVNGLWFEDKQFITMDRTGGSYEGALYCVWARFPNPVRIMVVRSTDGGITWSDTSVIGPVQHPSSCGYDVDAGQFAIPIVSANGDLHVFWMGAQMDSVDCAGYYSIKQRTSADGGASFAPEQVLLNVRGYMTAAGGVNTYSMPVGDADISSGPFAGNLYLAFANIGPEDVGRSDVDFIRSTDNGATWSSRITINDDQNSSLNDHFHPWLVCNEDGILACVFYDQRYDPSHYSFDLNAAYSFDGGETFTTNHRISSVSSSPSFAKSQSGSDSDGPLVQPIAGTSMMRPMAGKIGEYVGVSAFHHKINAVWTDTRDGNQEVYSARWQLPLLEPRLLLPTSTGYQPATQTFRWATTWKSTEDRYRLEVSAVNDFSTILVSQVVDTNYYVSSLPLADGLYYWRVKAFKIPTADSSASSAVATFWVDGTVPTTPTLISPTNNTVIPDSLPTFHWSASSLRVASPASLVTYDLQVSSDSLFPATAATRNYVDLVANSLKPANKLLRDVQYYWHVRAKDAAGHIGDYSSMFRVMHKASCCVGITGDINGDGRVDVGDLSFVVCLLTGFGCTPLCFAEANVNAIGGIDLADLSALVSFLTGGGYVLPNCP